MNATVLKAYMAMFTAAYIADEGAISPEQRAKMTAIGQRLVDKSLLMSDENMSEQTLSDVLDLCLKTLDNFLKSEGL